ncbi:MAG: sterol-binding protein [Gammaproteobacteria bacterium]|nr:MAG: sterol-binding protein [Gammaproteobacteria bacterium]
MTIRDLALESLESLLNELIGMDPQARQRLAAWHGKVIAVTLRGTGLTFYFIPDAQGGLQLLGRYEGEPDALIEGSPLDLMRASDKEQGTAQLFAGHVRISGDTELAHRFSEVLGGLDIDWEEQLSRYVGDVAAHELARLAREAQHQGKRLGATLARNLSEYLTEETRLVPHPFEIEAWVRAVETTRDDVERLAARIALLEKNGQGPAA